MRGLSGAGWTGNAEALFPNHSQEGDAFKEKAPGPAEGVSDMVCAAAAALAAAYAASLSLAVGAAGARGRRGSGKVSLS
jgi:hypothetical protein